MIYIYVLLQNFDKVPTSGGETNEILAWICGVLLTVLVTVVAGYEFKLNKRQDNHNIEIQTITTRLNTVIDESMNRLERKNQSKDTALQRLNDMIINLKEIIVLAKSLNKD